MLQEDRSIPIKPYGVFLGCGAFFAFYAFLHATLYNQGILHPALMLFGEKALLVWKGFPARMENFGFVYPPLPILIIGFLNGHLLFAQSLVSAVISTAIAVQIWKSARSRHQAWLWIIYLVFSFPILFVAVERFDLYLYFFVVVLSAKLLYRYKKEERLLDLFIAGPLLGISFFIHFSAIYLLPLFFVLIGLLYRDERMMPVALAFFLPSLAAIILFSSVNWMFANEPFLFLRAEAPLFANANIEATIAAQNIVSSFFYLMTHVGLALPVILPYFMGFRYNRNPFLILPFIVLMGLIYTHVAPLAVYLFAIFIIYTLIFTEWVPAVGTPMSLSVLCISLVAAPFSAFFSIEPHERNVAHAFFETGKTAPNIELFQSLVQRLAPTRGKILMDDAHGYPVVYLMNNMERFILPYQYEFAVALSNPADFADYAIAVKNKRNDLIFERFKNPVQSFRRSYENEKIIIWERIT